MDISEIEYEKYLRTPDRPVWESIAEEIAEYPEWFNQHPGSNWLYRTDELDSFAEESDSELDVPESRQSDG